MNSDATTWDSPLRDSPARGADDLIVNHRLLERRPRPADRDAELEAFRTLSKLIMADPALAIQRFVEIAMKLSGAGSAGLSMLRKGEDGKDQLVWEALAGAFAPHVGFIGPRDVSPCGLSLDRGETILVSRPLRFFSFVGETWPFVEEALVIPLFDPCRGPIASLWVASHDDAVRFDRTDADMLEGLAAQLTLALKLREAAAAHCRALAAHEAALQEAHHRVKNSIQATASLLGVQARSSASLETRDALGEAMNRLSVLAGVHELLQRSALRQQSVCLPSLMEALAEGLRQCFADRGERVRLRMQIDALEMSPNQAIPLALIVNEAVTNAYKYAFPRGKAGEIVVRLSRLGFNGSRRLSLTIEDDGVGLPAAARDGSLGLKLMRSFAVQLGGELSTVARSPGAALTLRMPMPEATERHGGAPAAPRRRPERGADLARRN